MRNSYITFCILLLFLVPFSASAQAVIRSVTVLAPSSMTNAMTEIIRIYSVKENITILAAYEGSAALADDIRGGEPADIYISDHPTKVRDLKREGVLDVVSISTLVGNRLVVVAAKDGQSIKKYQGRNAVTKALSTINETNRLVIGNIDKSPFGIISQRVLEKIAIWQKVEPYIIQANNTRNALAMIKKEKSIGLIYYTDAAQDSGVKIIAEVPSDLHDDIIYQVAVVAGENMEYARKFLLFLRSEEAQAVFNKYGFTL